MSRKHPRASSAVLLTRDGGREVFLVERSPKLSFFGGYWACPGGVVEASDRTTEAGRPSLEDLARCAVRELFEETGVATPELARLLAEDGGPSRRELRRVLLDGEAEPWSGWVAGGVLGTDPPESLRHVCTLTTPPFAPVRYRTEFWQLELPGGEVPTIEPGELVRGAVFRPEEVLERWLGGGIHVVPPVLFLLRELSERPLEDALRSARETSEAIAAGRLSEVRHTPGVFTAPLATPTIPPATTTNCYLVGEELVWVIDPATWDEGERARLFRLMDEWRAAGRRFGGVLATHHHRDHVGSVAETARRYDLEVLAHPLTLERLPERPPRVRALADGDRLPLGTAPDGRPDWSLRAYHTPGHDRGHLAFVEDRYGAAMVGDLVSTLSTIVIDPPEGHMRTYLESLERMAAEDLGVLYPSHGPAARDGSSCLRGFLAHRRRREEKLLGRLAAGTGETEALLAEVYDDAPRELRSLARRSLLAGLEKLEEDGCARRAGELWELAT